MLKHLKVEKARDEGCAIARQERKLNLEYLPMRGHLFCKHNIKKKRSFARTHFEQIRMATIQAPVSKLKQETARLSKTYNSAKVLPLHLLVTT